MKRLSILLSLSLLCNLGSAQHQFGLKAAIGVSTITSNSTFATSHESFLAPSGELGIFESFEFSPKSFAGIELYVSQISGTEALRIEVADENGNTEEGFANVKRGITYLTLPVYFGFRIKKFTINAGVQASLALNSWAVGNSVAFQNSSQQVQFTMNRGRSELHIDAFDIGPRIGFQFKLNDKISFDTNYYYGLNNIAGPNSFPGFELRVRQATVGMRYTLVKS